MKMHLKLPPGLVMCDGTLQWREIVQWGLKLWSRQPSSACSPYDPPGGTYVEPWWRLSCIWSAPAPWKICHSSWAHRGRPAGSSSVPTWRCWTSAATWPIGLACPATGGERRVNTLRPRQNGRHFADDIIKCIFLNVNVWIPIKISLKFVRKGPINNIPALV